MAGKNSIKRKICCFANLKTRRRLFQRNARLDIEGIFQCNCDGRQKNAWQNLIKPPGLPRIYEDILQSRTKVHENSKRNDYWPWLSHVKHFSTGILVEKHKSIMSRFCADYFSVERFMGAKLLFDLDNQIIDKLLSIPRFVFFFIWNRI